MDSPYPFTDQALVDIGNALARFDPILEAFGRGRGFKLGRQHGAHGSDADIREALHKVYTPL